MLETEYLSRYQESETNLYLDSISSTVAEICIVW